MTIYGGSIIAAIVALQKSRKCRLIFDDRQTNEQQNEQTDRKISQLRKAPAL